MSHHQPQQPTGPWQPPPIPPAAPSSKHKRWIPWVAYPGTLLLGLVLGASGNDSASTTAKSSATPTTTVTATAEAPAAEDTTPPDPPAAQPPTKANFKLTVKTLKKQCFGSAGCNVTYRIIPTYNGPGLDASEKTEVVYEVRGGEDGAVVNSFTVEDGQYSVDSEEMVSAKSSKSKLTAVATDVL